MTVTTIYRQWPHTLTKELRPLLLVYFIGCLLLTGLSIVTVIMERIHSELLNILLAFPCRMYQMNHEETGFSMSYMVCMRFTHSEDRLFLLRKSLMYNPITVLY